MKSKIAMVIKKALSSMDNKAGPTTRLEPPSYEFYQKKLDFERNRLNDWLI